MHVTFRCPSCGLSQHSLEFQDGSGELRCLCGWKKPLTALDITGETPNHCLVCGTQDLWRQKNFPPIFGVFFVAVGAIASSIAVYYYHPLWALGILMALALLDMVLYQVMSDVLVCYRCQARHGKVDLTGRVAYDHELGERYRQEEIRMQAKS
jgi:hypothetical protein